MVENSLTPINASACFLGRQSEWKSSDQEISKKTVLFAFQAEAHTRKTKIPAGEAAA